MFEERKDTPKYDLWVKWKGLFQLKVLNISQCEDGTFMCIELENGIEVTVYFQKNTKQISFPSELADILYSGDLHEVQQLKWPYSLRSLLCARFAWEKDPVVDAYVRKCLLLEVSDIKNSEDDSWLFIEFSNGSELKVWKGESISDVFSKGEIHSSEGRPEFSWKSARPGRLTMLKLSKSIIQFR